MKILKSGHVRKVYDAISGKRLRCLADLSQGQNLVLSSFDPFKKGPYRCIDFSEKPKKEVEVLKELRFRICASSDSFQTEMHFTLG